MSRLTLAILALVPLSSSHAGDLAVAASFPGGSVEVSRIDQEARRIAFAPARHPGRGWDCWWYFKVTGVRPGETLTLELTGTGFAVPDRASYSLTGKDWRHTAPGKREGRQIVYQQKVDAAAVWFAWGPPLGLKDARDWVEQIARQTPHARTFELCRSKNGRAVPALRIEQPGAAAADRVGIWVHARQHAWESGASWVGKGFVEWLVSDDPRAVTLRKKASIVYVPIMDVDNVERGAGGKNQTPHDHNRDWGKAPVWPEVLAAQAAIRTMSEAGRFDLYLDLHNPAPNDRQPFFFVPFEDAVAPQARSNQSAFLDAARLEIVGPLRLAAASRSTGPTYDKSWERISTVWVVKNTRPHVVAVCLETAWNTERSTTDNYLRVGKELGLAVERYFRTSRR